MLLLGLLPSAALGATGSISGTVVDAVDKTALEGVEVCAWALGSGEDGGCAETDSAGAYTIGDLESGEYGVEFWPGGLSYRHQVFDGKAIWSEADPVVVGSGETSGIDAELLRTGSIEGTVTAAEGGSPVAEVKVCAFEADSDELVNCAYTAPNGTYSVGRLEGGDYKVSFWSPDSGPRLALQFYDHRNRWVDADVVTVVEGEAKTGVDAELLPAAVIAGRVTSATTGLPLEEVRVCSIEALSGYGWTCTWTNANGNYGMRRFAPGVYKVAFETWGAPLEFWNDQPTLEAANTITLTTGQTVLGVDASLSTPALPPPATAVPPIVPRVVPRVLAPRRKCRRGYKRRLVRGKRRCVKVKRHRKRGHHRGSATARPSGIVFTEPAR
jgi:Carboxypeptidase regulatory-like domain